MKKFTKCFVVITSVFFVTTAFAKEPVASENSQQDTINSCIAAWKNSPFKKGHEADKTISPGVKVFGIGKSGVDDLDATSTPKLVLVRPAVNVLGKTKLRLMNPNGWYCFKSNVSVLGKMEIETDCKAHFASAVEGAEVLAADESSKGVIVLGSLRLKKENCDKQ